MKEKTLSWQLSSDVLFYLLLFLIASFPVIYSLSVDKHLSADGARYFAVILDEGDFNRVAWSRWFAEYLTQWPLVLAIKLEVKSIPLLLNFYAIGLYFPYIVSYLLCIYAVRKENSLLLAFPILSIIGINLSGDHILVGEHHVMVLLSWPILFLLLRKEPLYWLDGWLLWILLFLFSRTYEAGIIAAIIFSLILIVRLVRIYKVRQSSKQLIIYSISLFLSFLAIGIAFYFIVNPRDVPNRESFITAIIIGPRGHVGALVTSIFTFFLTIGLICRKKSFILVSLFPIALYVCILLFSSYVPSAGASFTTRTLSFSLLPLLLMCAVVLRYYNIKSNKISTRILVVFVLIMALGSLRFSNDWDDYRKQVIDIVTTKNGYINIEETIIKDSPHHWGRNNPELGIAWSYPCVRAILLNSPDTKSERFNPRKELILKNYISYDVFFRRVDKNVRVCK